MTRSRLFHAVVLAGSSWGAAVAGCSGDPSATPGAATSETDPSPTTTAPTSETDPGRPQASPGASDAGPVEAGIGTNSGPGHVMPDAGAHGDAGDGGPDGGWPPTK